MGRAIWWGSGSAPSMTELLDLDRAALAELVESLGQPGYRARQIWRQMYQRGVTDPLAMSDPAGGISTPACRSQFLRLGTGRGADFRRRVDQQGASATCGRRTD